MLEIKYVDIEELVKWDRNPKRHDIGSLVESFKKYGFRDAPIYDEAIGGIIAGNGRVEALVAMKEAGESAPDGVKVDNGKWYIPIQIGINSRSRKEAEEFGIDHNNITLLGGDLTAVHIAKIWDEVEFLDLSKELDLISLDGDDIDYLIRKAANEQIKEYDDDVVEEEEDEEEEDNVEEIYTYTDMYGVEVGQVWDLNGHILICGDSNEVDFGDHDLVVTDLPNDMDYNPNWRRKKGVKTGNFMYSDKVDTSWLNVLGKFDKNKPVYMWVVDKYLYDAMRYMNRKLSNTIIWDKRMANFAIGNYNISHEVCLYYGSNEKWNGVNDEITIWAIEREKNKLGLVGWETVKPTECMLRPIKNSSSEGDVVLDPFIGVGTTLIACERSGRKCKGIDTEPLYISASIHRWVTETNGVPKCLS